PPRQQASRVARVSATGSRALAQAERDRARGARADRARRDRSATPAADAQRARVADAERAARRRDGRREHDEQGHRPGALRDAEDRRGAPLERLPEARDLLARTAA